MDFGERHNKSHMHTWCMHKHIHALCDTEKHLDFPIVKIQIVSNIFTVVVRLQHSPVARRLASCSSSSQQVLLGTGRVFRTERRWWPRLLRGWTISTDACWSWKDAREAAQLGWRSGIEVGGLCPSHCRTSTTNLWTGHHSAGEDQVWPLTHKY